MLEELTGAFIILFSVKKKKKNPRVSLGFFVLISWVITIFLGEVIQFIIIIKKNMNNLYVFTRD